MAVAVAAPKVGIHYPSVGTQRPLGISIKESYFLKQLGHHLPNSESELENSSQRHASPKYRA